MKTITFDDKSLMLDNQRIQLVSGAVHYFRIPHEEWRDRLEKCRQGGLNTIETYVAWNFHEYREGEYDFTGDKDLGAFLDLCQEYGFYTILRPSPYICAEWDSGGLPAWLSCKDGVAFRCTNDVFLAAVDRWYDVLIPVIARRQWTQGGSVILVQVENEYGYFESVQDMAYMAYLRDGLLRRGVEVPLLTCDSPGIGALLDGTVKGANFGSNFAHGLRVLREEQPEAYLFVSELWLAWFDHWGGHHQTRSGRDVANALKEVLAAGGHYNFYMWCGGTNFGYFAGRTTTGEYGAFNTTSYDYDAPIGETGNLTLKYSECRLVNWMAQSFQDLFASSSGTSTPSLQSSNSSIHVTERVSPVGRAIFLTNSSSEPQFMALTPTMTAVAATSSLETQTEKLIQDGVELPGVWVQPKDTKVLFSDMRLSEDVRLVSTTLEAFTQVKSGDRTTLLLYGDPYEEFLVTLADGHKEHLLTGTVPDSMTPSVYPLGNTEIVVMNRKAAYVTWLNPDSVESSWWVDADYGKRTVTLDLPGLNWEQADVMTSLEKSASRTRVSYESGFPKSLDTYGILNGYGWYETEFYHDGGETSLILSHVRDRALVYVNDQFVGTVGSFSRFAHLPISCVPGQNRLRILADGLGRYNFTSRLGERKGIYGPVYVGGEPLQVPDWTIVGNRLEMQLSVQLDHSVLIRLSELNKPARIFVGDALVYEYRGIRVDDEFVELNLGELIDGTQGPIRIDFDDNELPSKLPSLKAVSYAKNRPLDGKWVVRAGIIGEDSNITLDMSAFERMEWKSEDFTETNAFVRPRLFRSHFQLDLPTDGSNTMPVKVSLEGVSKGVVWINGQNLGRHWDIGPQTALYVPLVWLSAENEIVIFDEMGYNPAKVSLIHTETFQ